MIDFKPIKILNKSQAFGFGYPIIIFHLRPEITLAVVYKYLNATTYIQAEFIALWLPWILKRSLRIFNLNIAFCFYAAWFYIIYQVCRIMIFINALKLHFIWDKYKAISLQQRCHWNDANSFVSFFNTAITR